MAGQAVPAGRPGGGLRRARDLLAVKGHDTRDTVLACYGGAGFQQDMPGDVRLIGLPELYG